MTSSGPDSRSLTFLLADLYPTQSSARRAIDEAQLPDEFIDLEGAAIQFWSATLREARKRRRVEALIQVAQADYPEREEELRAAFEAYVAETATVDRRRVFSFSALLAIPILGGLLFFWRSPEPIVVAVVPATMFVSQVATPGILEPPNPFVLKVTRDENLLRYDDYRSQVLLLTASGRASAKQRARVDFQVLQSRCNLSDEERKLLEETEIGVRRLPDPQKALRLKVQAISQPRTADSPVVRSTLAERAREDFTGKKIEYLCLYELRFSDS